MIRNPFRFYDVPPPPPTYFGGTLPEVMVSSDEVPYPYYNQLTPEERSFFNDEGSIGRGVRSIAMTGKRGQTYSDLSRVAKDAESFAAEMTGIPGSIRFAQDPVKKLKGAGRTIEATILGSSPFIASPYNQEDVADTFDALDAFGFATLAFAPLKTPLQQGIKSSGRYLTQGPLKNAYRLNPVAAKQPTEVILSRVQRPGQTADLSRLDELLQRPSESLTLAERIELARINQPGYGRGFSSNPNDISYYSSPGIQSSRGYVGMPEIRSIRLPAEKAARFNIRQNPVEGYFSGAPGREYLLPRNYVESSKTLTPQTFEELEQIRRSIDAETTALNTPHWWRGYPTTNTPKQLPGFRSEIDWGKWNPDTPKYPELINEYNAIEESTKKAGTWMKNADGSPFKGTAEQFIQQQSSYFKKAFPNPVRERRPDFFSDEVLGGQDPKKYFDENMPIQYNYHSSPNEFDFFDENLFSTGGFGKGIYTTRLPQNMYGKNQYQLYLNANNPQPYSYTRFVTKNGSEVAERVNAPKLVHEKTFYQQLEPGRDYFNPAEESSQSVVPFSNYPKSAIGNVGFFDMTNPNIYKSMMPLGAIYGGRNYYRDKQMK